MEADRRSCAATRMERGCIYLTIPGVPTLLIEPRMDIIFWIKVLHTLVFFFASTCILYVVYCGVVAVTTRRLWLAISSILIIGLANAINGFECPLATLVHELAGTTDVSDIFFPDWFAHNIFPVSTVIFLFGVILVLRNTMRGRASRSG